MQNKKTLRVINKSFTKLPFKKNIHVNKSLAGVQMKLELVDILER